MVAGHSCTHNKGNENMKKNEFEFKDEQLDSFKYSEKLAELENLGSEFDSAVNILKQSGLPANKKFIREHVTTEMALRLYLNTLAKADLENVGGLMADDGDREKIVSKYKVLFDNLKSVVPVFDKVFNRGIIKATESNGVLTYDREFNKNAARLYATYFVNGDELSKYHEMCAKMAEMRKQVKAFELKHNIRQSFGLGVLFDYADRFGDTDVMRCMMIDDYFANHDNSQLWLKMFGNYFKTDGAQKKEEK